MNYQLVLQFRGDSLENFSRLETLETRLIETLGDSISFDGNDVGLHGANLFFYTNDPASAFDRMRPLLDNTESAAGFTAAYRTVAENSFHILWPVDSAAGFNLR
jgi:hypothetical protein